MARKVALLFAVMTLGVALAASADWNSGDPRKWVQYPDLTELGIDVNASFGYILADDFLCEEPGYITTIHIWGSWLNDYLPFGRPDSVQFVLSIHADIPASQSPTGYSMPGDVLWFRAFRPGEFRVRTWVEGAPEGWMDPPDMYIFPADYICWQYNFYIPQDERFFQMGTVDEPVTYWLDVKAFPSEDLAQFGWKTSLDHWMDDAVWGQGAEPYFGPWYELRYPPGHELYGQSIDLAFVIVGEAKLDWGDAPDGAAAPGYPTLAIHNGASHIIAGPWLGDAADAPDPEIDGQPDPNALGDDNDGNDDEDGVLIPVLMQGTTSTITVEVNDGGSGTGGVLEAWIDFNGDQTWQAAEMIFGGWLPGGIHALNVTTPASAVVGQTFARFRISLAGGLSPVGTASDGEVEDHEVWIEEQQTFKWRQMPDLTDAGIDVNATYPFYILADDFLCTEPGRIVVIQVWGSWLEDYLPLGEDPTAVDFVLSFHSDIPVGPDGYSIPGDVEWYRRFVPGEFDAVIWAESLYEGWLNPPDDYWWPGDYTCWLYRFFVPVDEAFFQRGSEANPIVYWLDVQAYPYDPDAWFGWKTSIDHWNDDAVFGFGPEPYLGPWYELIYPLGHPQYGESIDLAFRLINDPLSEVPSHEPIPEGFGLYQNVPNPFSASTTIRYSLPASARVKLEVYDVNGRIVTELVDEVQAGGMQTVTWSGTDSAGRQMPAGIYFYRLISGLNTATQKMLYLR